MLTLSIARTYITQNAARLYTTTTMASQNRPLLVAVVGVGLVGSEFIRQLLSIRAPSPFRLIALSSSSRILFTGKESPITADKASEWKSLLASSATRSDLKQLTAQLSALVEDNERVALVDNTSSEEVASFYPTWLKAGIHVVTPNKKAFSGEKELYESILQAAKESGARFLNESTVGAGLPIIAPLKELLATGDKVRFPFIYFKKKHELFCAGKKN